MKAFSKRLAETINLISYCPEPELIKSWASVNLIFSLVEEEPSIAMIKRATNPLDPWSGHYAFPGGRLESEEGYWEAARRETYEEIGISSNPLGEFLKFQVRYQNKSTPYAISAHLSFYDQQEGHFSIDETEVEEAFWFPLKNFLREENVKNLPLGRDKVFRYPCVTFDGHIIWGISYFILWELFNQLSPLNEPVNFRTEHLPAYSYHHES